MLSFDAVSDEVLDRIAQLIGHRLSILPIPGLSPDLQLELAETMQITQLPAQATGSDPGMPQFRGRWFHMLKSGSRYVGHALSTSTGPTLTDWKIEGVFLSELSTQIAVSLRWIDDKISTDGVVRMLVAPGHHLHAFTITSGEEIEVVIAHLPRQAVALSKRKIYSWHDFVVKLHATVPVRGIKTTTTK